jgi:hypothetical protein
VWVKPCQSSDYDSIKGLSPYKGSDTFTNSATSALYEFKKSWTAGNGNTIKEPRQQPDQQQHQNPQYQQQQHVFNKSYSSVRPVRNKTPTYNLNSSSLFCSSQDESCGKPADVAVPSASIMVTSGGVDEIGGGSEYSLFGSHQFGSTFIKSPII